MIWRSSEQASKTRPASFWEKVTKQLLLLWRAHNPGYQDHFIFQPIFSHSLRQGLLSFKFCSMWETMFVWFDWYLLIIYGYLIFASAAIISLLPCSKTQFKDKVEEGDVLKLLLYVGLYGCWWCWLALECSNGRDQSAIQLWEKAANGCVTSPLLLSTFNFQISTFNFQLSTFNFEKKQQMVVSLLLVWHLLQRDPFTLYTRKDNFESTDSR